MATNCLPPKVANPPGSRIEVGVEAGIGGKEKRRVAHLLLPQKGEVAEGEMKAVTETQNTICHPPENPLEMADTARETQEAEQAETLDTLITLNWKHFE